MEVTTFLKENFPNLKLEPPLFYNWPIGIRYEIGMPNRTDLTSYLQGCYKRAITLFDEINEIDDQIVMVIDVFNKKVGSRNILPYLKDKKNKRVRLEHVLMEELVVHRFSFVGTKNEIYYKQLVKKICDKDFYSFMRKKDYIVYFINLDKKTIYYLYDDRGCDIIASDRNNLRHLYEKYNEWILDYDREEIDKIFHDN